MATVTVDVAANAAIGARDLFVAGASRPAALAVFDSVDSIKVTPDWAMARVGGVAFPKALAQFEARASTTAPTASPTRRTTSISGSSTRTWSLEEFAATYDDDDIKFVGADRREDGPVHAEHRRPEPGAARAAQQHRRRVGGGATTPPEAADGKPAKTLRARAHLLVTVPLYMRFEPSAGPPEPPRRPGTGQ